MHSLSKAKLAITALAGVVLALVIVSRPLTAPLPATVRISDMTWVEVRSAIEHGYDRVLVPSGGIEQNGPHMILGKHDHIVNWTAGLCLSRGIEPTSPGSVSTATPGRA